MVYNGNSNHKRTFFAAPHVHLVRQMRVGPPPSSRAKISDARVHSLYHQEWKGWKVPNCRLSQSICGDPQRWPIPVTNSVCACSSIYVCSHLACQERFETHIISDESIEFAQELKKGKTQSIGGPLSR